MSLQDLILTRRRRFAGYQPRLEVLEARECLSVAAPASLTATALSSTQVKLTWTNVVGEFGFRVFRWDGTKAVLVSQLAKDTTTFTVSNLLPTQTNWFTVEAFDNATTARTAWVSIATPASPITAPTNLRAGNIGLNQATLLWNFATNATGYRIFGWDGSQEVLLGTVSVSTNSFTVGSLTPGGTFYFYVQAFNATNTASTDWLTVQTTNVSITAPKNFKATNVTTSTVNLSWTDSAGETGYRVFRWDGAATVQIAALAANVTGYQAVGLLPGKAYSFYVQAFNATNSANSIWANITTTSATLPLQPPVLLAPQVVAFSSVQLKWTAPAGATSYKIFIWNGLSWSLVNTVLAGTNQATISGLATFRTHWFMVQAFKAGTGESAYSNTVFANL